MYSKATFEVYEDRVGEWRWRLVHDNGRIIADSGEGYASKQKAKEGLRSVKTNAADADVVEAGN
ncbi:HVO_2922 family protein [Halorarum salinum]|uniref:YegP family protein n=1 Tax=Halorarum salinum TaxID=2743089 RepID=A0A7D5LB82_9EURY|nr:HVO_2922 family protein [Halobaculum salinum]QLG62430.1 YegP family protein [Halobaculum salinum]